MARSIKEIKKSMTDQFMSDATIRRVYRLSGSTGFEDTFSSVSIESIIFYIVASAIYLVEVLFETFAKEVNDALESSVLATIPWYHRMCLEFQYGDDLVYDETTCRYGYQTIDDSKRVVRYASCSERGNGIVILVAGDDGNGNPVALQNDVLEVFKQYMNSVKPAGILLDVYTFNPDNLYLSITVQYNQLVLSRDGSLINDPAVFPVENAIRSYLQGIVYGGTFNKTKLVDAVQMAEGVVDVTVDSAYAVTADGLMTTISGNNYTSKGGALVAMELNKSISYVLQI